MKLSLKNIGKIETASVEINGITVIAGENNTGKSTVGRALFAVFNSFYNIQKQIESERVQNIENLIDMMYRNVTNRYTRRFDSGEIAQKIVAQIYLYKDDTEAVKDIIVKTILQYDENFEKHIGDNSIDEYIVRIKDGLNVADLDIFKSVLEKKLDAEFAGEVNNIFTDKTGEIVLSIKDTNIIVTIEDNAVKSVVGKIDLHTQTVYIDDPFVIDEVRYTYGIDNSSLDHRGYLREKLNKENNANLIDEIIASNKLDNIYRKISTVMLMNGTIEYNGTIILDEPEIHLHPEWQLLFAELIVLIQKEFGVHILLNTHSPYFLNAIEVYAVKYGINDRCKYYLASSQDDISTIGDVTNNIELIYSKLARPLQELENERGRL